MQVTIYTRGFCGYCTRALSLLRRKGVTFKEIDIGCEPGAREEMIQRSMGRRTVPQIFIGDTHVGGCDDLHALEREGRLDPLLAGS
ncbi:MAG: glutaredoxin 3 [Hyphomonadaceae bacterium]